MTKPAEPTVVSKPLESERDQKAAIPDLTPMQRFKRNMPVIAEQLRPDIDEEGKTGSEEAETLSCGHHPSLLVKSVESDAQWCELCDMRSQRNDAVEMEYRYKSELNSLHAERDQLRMERDAAWNEAIEAAAQRFDGNGFGPYAHPSPAIRSLARPIPAKIEGNRDY